MSTLLKLSRVEAGAVSGDLHRVIQQVKEEPGHLATFLRVFRDEVRHYLKLSHLQSGDSRFDWLRRNVGCWLVEWAWTTVALTTLLPCSSSLVRASSWKWKSMLDFQFWNDQWVP